MKKVKLPRKRKKAYIKAKGRASYFGLQICIEMIIGVVRMVLLLVRGGKLLLNLLFCLTFILRKLI